ncbi:hypothetical protein DRN98_00995 [Methanosarcinales archaeon]|nr:MAG: hypothetical protein DRN98_00995 [Methanosarcinales archaeon]
MNNITSLYTPGTGLPDFEMRIALGLCATALNCLTPEKIKLVEQFDRYVIEVEEEKHKVDLLLTKALGWLCQNRLSDEKLLIRIPGFRQKWLEKQARRVSEFGKRLLTDDVKLTSVFVERVEKRKGAHVIVCGHNYSKAEKIMDALLSFSPHLGKPPKRNNCANIKNLPLCPFCIAVGLAGTVLFQVDININHPNRSKKEQIFFLPHFRGQTRGEELAQYLAITKHIDGNLDDIPAPAALLTLLSLYPHLADLFGNFDASFFIGRADSSGNAPRYGYQAERAAW